MANQGARAATLSAIPLSQETHTVDTLRSCVRPHAPRERTPPHSTGASCRMHGIQGTCTGKPATDSCEMIAQAAKHCDVWMALDISRALPRASYLHSRVYGDRTQELYRMEVRPKP